MIVTRTPMRITLGGGGTDLPSYYAKYGGFLVSAAINKYTYITVNPRFEDSIRVSYSQTEIADQVEDIQHPLVREALKLLEIRGGIEIVSLADVPSNTGLGSSGSFLVGLLLALHAYKKEQVGPQALAEEAFHIEAEVLGEPVGKQDQYVAAFGGVISLDIDRQGTVKVCEMSLPDQLVEELETCLVYFYTGIRRAAGEVLRDQSQATRASHEGVTSSLHAIKEIGYQVKAAMEKGDLDAFGRLLDRHWQTKKGLSTKVSQDSIDRWYEIARQNGALGGKIMGAGGGGFFMFYTNHGDKNMLRQALGREGLRETRFRLEPSGSKVLLNL